MAKTACKAFGGVTDELCTEFYECPICEFQRIPHAIDSQFTTDSYDNPTLELTARYYPGCGITIEWEER